MKLFKTIAMLSLASTLIADHSVASTNSTSQFSFNSSDYGDTHYLIRLVELDRNEKTSTIRVTQKTLLPPTAGIMTLTRGFYELAKSRGAEYFVNLKEWNDNEGGRIYVVGFTNTKDADLKKEFGEMYDYQNESDHKRDYMSVSECKMLFDHWR